MLQRMAADFLLSKPNPVAYPDESFGDISEAGRAFLRRLLTCRPEERASVTEALALPWLQPVTDEGLRARMSEAAPRHVVESRRAEARRQRWRAAGRKVMTVNWWMGAARKLKEEGECHRRCVTSRQVYM